MKLIHLLPIAALSAAFVIPDERVLNQIAFEQPQVASSPFDSLPSKADVNDAFSRAAESAKGLLDDALNFATEAGEGISNTFDETVLDAKTWFENAATAELDGHGPRGPHGPHGPHRGHGHHGKPNLTVYELIAKSNYTTKLAALINEFDDVVELLNGTTANFTIFAPTDRAFEKIPDHAPKPSKEFLKKILVYHVSPEFYPAGRVLATHTIPTLLGGEHIGGEPQRVSINLGFRGLTVNFFSRVIAIDIFGTNGVIHGIDSLLIPPPNAAKIISFLPGEFSTLELGLVKTGLYDVINDTSNHVGGTLFAPSNFAFQKLGPKINGFLFSKYGQKYLKAILAYHVVPNHTLYSDAYYTAKEQDVGAVKIPKGLFHVDLPTLLKDHSLSIDVFRYGRVISIKINGFSEVTIPDGIASDGVIHVVNNVIIPPKNLGGAWQQWQGEELTVEDFIERLQPFVIDAEEL